MLQQYCRIFLSSINVEKKYTENTENLPDWMFLSQNIPKTRMFWKCSACLKLLARVLCIMKAMYTLCVNMDQ